MTPRDVELALLRDRSDLYMSLYADAIEALTPFAAYVLRENGIHGFSAQDLAPLRDLMDRGLIYVD